MHVNLETLADPTPAIASFRHDLLNQSEQQILRKHVLYGPCYTLPNRDAEYALLQEVADHFQVHPTTVTVVGSGKLGFSIAPTKRYKAFNDKSDIDVALVNAGLFNRVWWEIHEAVAGRYDWPQRKAFSDYLMRGWIRPDKFPEVDGKLVSGWWEYFNALSKRVGVKVRCAVYKNWRFFESYHCSAIAACCKDEQLRNDARQARGTTGGP